MATSYAEFLAAKRRTAQSSGPQITPDDISAEHFFGFQRYLTAWAVKRGRAAIWATTGMGKTRIQVEWARRIISEGQAALVVAPLAVCAQTVREAAAIGVPATYTREGIPGPGIWVTNYEMISTVDPDAIAAVVLDEASILKQSNGRMRTGLIEHFRTVPYRLACTATPAPNDCEELTNQAEWLGVMRRVDMLAAYFVHDDTGWRLKRHARRPMFEWMASWAVALNKPSDLGFSDDGYQLPGLEIVPHRVASDIETEGQLFTATIGGVGGRAKVRRETLEARCVQAAKLIAEEPDEPWLIWCGLNAEAERLAELIADSVNVHGAWAPEAKAQALLDFADGKIRRLITKPSIASLGMNFQCCARMAFVGLSDSYEQYFQAIRRCYRFGQERVVKAHVVVSDLESQIAANVERKEREAAAMTAELVAAMASVHGTTTGRRAS